MNREIQGFLISMIFENPYNRCDTTIFQDQNHAG